MTVAQLQDYLLHLMMEGRGDAEILIRVLYDRGTYVKAETIDFYRIEDGGVDVCVLEGGFS